jgi:Cft2 family RNA processing exonuclease
VRSEAVIDGVLIDAAETLIRNPSRRPHWLPAGFPMKLILTRKRDLLVAHVLADRSLRKQLRRSRRRLVDPDLLVGVTAAEFEERMAGSSDPHRFVATALIAEDEALAVAAQPLALDPARIPAPASPVHRQSELRAVTPPDEPTTVTGHDQSGPDQRAGDEVTDASEPMAVDDAPDEPGLATEPPLVPAEPDPLVTALRAERDRLRTRVARLEAQVLELQTQIPTKRQRRREHKQEGRLKRSLVGLEAANEQLAALRSERDELVRIRRELDDQLAEAEEARAVAQRKSQHLERQLATAEGRSEYLRRSVDKELAEVRALVDVLPYGRDRTNATRRIGVLTRLTAALDEAFPNEPEPQSRTRRVTVGRSHDFVVTPLGGGTEIGGSAILVEAAGRRILVDAGMHPDGRGPARIDELGDERLDAIVVTHAHNDHAGYVPALVDRFPNMKVICSCATAHLLPTMWADSVKVMDRAFEEADDGTIAPLPLYGQAEVEIAEERIEDRPYDRQFNLGDLRLTLFAAGHIFGAAGVVIEGGDRRVVVTGDISGPDDRYLSVDPTHLPEGLVAGADLLVIETTYCQREHRSRDIQERGLVDAVRSVVERRGRVLIPAFGLGRAQEVVLIVSRHLPDVDILVDGLAKDIATVYETIGEESGRSLPILGGRVQPVMNRARELRAFHTGVVVASSGMLTGGPSVAWAQKILPDERAALLLCGYQDEEAPGRRLERLTNGGGQRTLRLPDQDLGWVDVEIRAEVRKYALSAHADRRGLLDIIERVRPKQTMLVHGIPEDQAGFRAELHRMGVRTVPTDRWTSCPA